MENFHYIKISRKDAHRENYTAMSNVKIVSYKFIPVSRIALLLPTVTYKCDYEIQDQFFQLIE